MCISLAKEILFFFSAYPFSVIFLFETALSGNASIRSVQEAKLHLAGILQVQDEFEMSGFRLWL